MKKILTFVFALAAILALCSMSVFAEETAVAKIGDTEYTSIEEAFNDAQSGNTITLVKDTEANALLSVKSGVNLTLDLNGCTITAVDGRLFVISVEDGGSLTINDASNAGGIVNNNVQGYAILNYGSLTVNGGNFVGDYALYNGAYTNANASATLNGGTFSANENAFYSIANCSNLTISGATVNDWVSTSANFEMTSGSVENLYAGPADAEVASGIATNLVGGTVSSLCITETNPVTVENATINDVDAVAIVNNTYYQTLQSALDAATNGETVVVLCDVELTESLVVSKNSNTVIDLAGYTISQSVECTGSYQMINNNGTLYITDSIGGGKISFTDTGVGDPTFGWGSYTIRNDGTLVIENVTVENLTQINADGVSHMYCAIFQYVGSCTITNSTISNPTYRSVHVWNGDLTINSGNFIGQVWLKTVSAKNELSVAINGGTFAPTGVDGSSVFVTNAHDLSSFSVTGGTFTTKIGCSDPSALAGSIVGGTFSEAAITSMGENSVLFGGNLTLNEDGSYTVVIALENAFTFLGYSVNATKDSITVGYVVDQELIALYLEQNGIESFDFGCAFGINEINEKTCTSFAQYTEYQTFNAKIVGIDQTNENHITANLMLALYVDLGNGKSYVVGASADSNATKIVTADEVTSVTFAPYL